MTEKLSLESVESAFSCWRANRRHRSEPIPSHLWSQVDALLPHYKHSVIRRCLGINGDQIKKRLSKQQQSDTHLSRCHFVMATPSINEPEQTLEVMLCGERKKTITLTLTLDILQQLLPQLMDAL